MGNRYLRHQIIPEGGSTVSTGVVPVSEARRFTVRYHIMAKSNTLKRESSEIVDMAALGTRIFILPREISVITR